MLTDYVTLCEYESVVVGNFNSWANRQENVLFIGGIYKEGNSTLGKQIAKKYNAEYVNLFDLEHEFARHNCQIYMLDHDTRTNILINKVKADYKGKRVVVEDVPKERETKVKGAICEQVSNQMISFNDIYESIL